MHICLVSLKATILAQDLADALKEKLTLVATKLSANVEARVEPYMPYFLAFELIDLTASNKEVLPVNQTTWDAIEDVVDRFGDEVPASHQPPATSHQPPATSRQPPAASHQPPATSRQPPATSHQPQTCLLL